MCIYRKVDTYVDRDINYMVAWADSMAYVINNLI